ncbi:oligosaccharide flippase family protein [Peteryoungia algae]|uniref:Oligosaccharide flippase family protein n=1 Tax=Peteryoungia algae TaxID=2919917 RepID=A0ABT0CZX7_9HYPH|nr:oligosaccharide flippase family protein [Rhizobium sp. SSM4.3]MCJ8238706.1 oligosaccharide flippase family protein [Rhizobium sp. SSM4.3]
MIANIAQQGVAFLGTILIARLLPAEEFAQVRIAMAYVAVATILGAGGLTAPILRYCADPLIDAPQRRRLLGIGLRRLIAIAFLATGAFLGIVIGSGSQGTEFMVLTAYALQVPALAATSLLLVYLQAIQRFKFLAYAQIGLRTASFLITVTACYLHGLPGLLIATLGVVAASVVPLLHAARPSFRQLEGDVPGDFTSLAGYSLLGMVITTIGQYADLMMLDWVGAERSDVGVYSLATIFFFAASALAGAVQSVATPQFTGLIRDRAGFRSSLLRWSVWLMAGGIVVATGAIIVAWLLEVFFLSEAYSGLSMMVALLMLRFCIWSAYAVGGAAMVGIGAIKQGMAIAFITTSFAIFIGYPLVLWYGVWGAGIAQVLVAFLTAVLVLRVVVREAANIPISE